MNNEKAYALAKKLKALADRGEAGEAKNASRLLAKLLQEHNIEIDDLEKEERHRCEYNIMLRHQKLFWALVFHVVENYDGRYWTKHGSKKIIILELTYAEQLELTAMFDHYCSRLEANYRLLNQAFIHKHELYPKRTKDFDASKVTKKSQMDDEDYWRMIDLMNGIHRDDYKKRIDDMSKLLED